MEVWRLHDMCTMRSGFKGLPLSPAVSPGHEGHVRSCVERVLASHQERTRQEVLQVAKGHKLRSALDDLLERTLHTFTPRKGWTSWRLLRVTCRRCGNHNWTSWQHRTSTLRLGACVTDSGVGVAACVESP